MNCEFCNVSKGAKLVRPLGPGREMAICEDCYTAEVQECRVCGHDWFAIWVKQGICPNCAARS